MGFCRCWILSFLSIGICLSAFTLGGAGLITVPQLGLRVPTGFRATLYADSGLANDIQAMTLDSDGNVVVTGPGYIRTLYDANGDGLADSSTEFGRTVAGGMGLCFDGMDLLFVGDGGLWRYRDANGDGISDQPRERLLEGAGGEHGVHAIRRGPDGYWYWMVGNDAGFGRGQTSTASSPVRSPEAGALLRLSPGFGAFEVIAHGFRNPYDFDFNQAGDLFTYDSDTEADFLLPWYSPTRVYHIGLGDHHGWRLPGWRRSWSRPSYGVDTVELAVSLGRGSPTGVEVYRHYQFPTYFRNGVFVADWTFGRVMFLQLREDGPSYAAVPEVFIEAIGGQGFAPTDLAVGRDGCLYVSIGGRGTRGGVYRLDYVADAALTTLGRNWRAASLVELWAVLDAPEPLSAWSRAYWVPLAVQAGASPFDAVMLDELAPVRRRLRAVEILTEIHGGLASQAALRGARSAYPEVRARVAWSLGRLPCGGFGPILLGLVRDVHPMVRRFAMDAVNDRYRELDLATIQAAITANLSHPDERLRRASARLAARLPAPAWEPRWQQSKAADFQSRLTTTLALLWRESFSAETALKAMENAAGVLNESTIVDQRLQAVRLMILAMGDWRLNNPSLELYTGYEAAGLTAPLKRVALGSVPALKTAIGSGGDTLDVEATRLLAMLQATDAEVPGKVLGLITPQSLFSLDFHYLTVFSRLGGPGTPSRSVTAKVADALLSMEVKLGDQRNWARMSWTPRLLELLAALVANDPELPDAIVEHPKFPLPGHLALIAGLESRKEAAARRFFEAAKKEARFEWTSGLVELLSILPREEVHPLFRQHWNVESLREVLLLQLAGNPNPADLAKYVWGVTSANDEVVSVSLTTLQQLPRDASGQALSAAARLLVQLFDLPQEQRARARALEFIRWQTGQKLPVQETAGDLASLWSAYKVVFDWIERTEPALGRELKAHRVKEVGWMAKLNQVNWAGGDAVRGESIYRQRGCGGCHSGTTALGPDLSGVSRRFSPPDLLLSMVFPSRQVAPPYRMTAFRMKDGSVVQGVVAYESAEGVILRTGVASTIRLSAALIERRELTGTSVMPEGLLDGLSAGQLADLNAYLRGL